jgi:hypothetical protein
MDRPIRRSPKRTVIDRKKGLELDRLLESIRSPDWFLLWEFQESPRQAYNYQTRMKKKHGSRFDFSASIEEDGVGRLYARLSSGQEVCE